MKSSLKPLAEALNQDSFKATSEGAVLDRSLFETQILGVPLVRFVLQVASAVVAVYLFGDLAGKLPPAMQLLGVGGIAVMGLYFGYVMWAVFGEGLTDFLSKVFPFSFS